MVDEDVRGSRVANQLAIVDRPIFQARIRRLDEDFRVVSGSHQDALNAQHLVTDRVAVAERGEHLMDARPGGGYGHADCERSPSAPAAGTTAPDGMRARSSAAAAQSRRLRASQPGS